MSAPWAQRVAGKILPGVNWIHGLLFLAFVLLGLLAIVFRDFFAEYEILILLIFVPLMGWGVIRADLLNNEHSKNDRGQ